MNLAAMRTFSSSDTRSSKSAILGCSGPARWRARGRPGRQLGDGIAVGSTRPETPTAPAPCRCGARGSWGGGRKEGEEDGETERGKRWRACRPRTPGSRPSLWGAEVYRVSPSYSYNLSFCRIAPCLYCSWLCAPASRKAPAARVFSVPLIIAAESKVLNAAQPREGPVAFPVSGMGRRTSARTEAKPLPRSVASGPAPLEWVPPPTPPPPRPEGVGGRLGTRSATFWLFAVRRPGPRP